MDLGYTVNISNIPSASSTIRKKATGKAGKATGKATGKAGTATGATVGSAVGAEAGKADAKPKKQPALSKFTPIGSLLVDANAVVKVLPKPAEVATKPAEVVAEVATETTETTEVPTKPAEVTTKPAKVTTKPAKADAKPAKADAKPAEIATETAEVVVKPADVPTEDTTETADDASKQISPTPPKIEPASLLSSFESAGISVTAIEAPTEKTESEQKAVLQKTTSYMKMSKQSEELLRDMAVTKGLIPHTYRNASFDRNRIINNIKLQRNKSSLKFRVIHFETYTATAENIINTIRLNRIPEQSFIIGAPLSFGKQSFATDCILASLNNGWITVPYISLVELGELKAANDRVIERGLMGMETKIASESFNYNTGEYEDATESYYYAMGDPFTDIKLPKIITGRYSWSEYINAPILVCFFSGIESKLVESQTLFTLMNIRSAKGYPTIAMISTSLDPYTKDPNIGRYVWSEILSYSDTPSVSKFKHVSTFKSYD